MKVELKGKSRHGKNRVKQHGNLWKVMKINEGRDFGKGFIRSSDAPGPWFWLESINCKCSTCNKWGHCLLYTSPSPRDATLSRMPSSA